MPSVATIIGPSPEMETPTDPHSVSFTINTPSGSPAVVQPSLAPLTPAPVSYPGWLLRRLGGATVLDTSDPSFVDVNLTRVEMQTNGPDVFTVDIPVAMTDLVALFVDANLSGLTPARGATFEVECDSVLRPRMVLVGAHLDGEKVTVSLADRRYETTRRYVGRGVDVPNQTATFFASSGTPSGWTLTATDMVTAFAYAGADPYGGTNAMQIVSDGSAPNYYSAQFTPATVPFQRSAGFAGLIYLPAGFWSPNTDAILAQIVTTDNATGTVKETQTLRASLGLPEGIWISFATDPVTIPANGDYTLEVRLFTQLGTFLVDDLNSFITEALYWTDTDSGQIVRDLINHANDATFSHTDTGLRADSTSVPNTGVVLSRVIASAEKQQVSSAVTEILNTSDAWSWLEANSDGTDQYRTDAQSTVCPVVVTNQNAQLSSWEWIGDNHTEMLGVFAPDLTDWLHQRLIVYVTGAGIPVRGSSYSAGREHYDTGPYGNYDPRVAVNLLGPFYNAMSRALAATVTVKDPAMISAYAAGTLRPGVLIDCNVGEFPRSLIGRFRCIGATITPPSGECELTLNRVA